MPHPQSAGPAGRRRLGGLAAALLAALGAAYIDLIELHTPEGQLLYVNPAEVTTIREPLASSRGHFPRGTHCVVSTASGGIIGVREDCDAVRALLAPQDQR